MSKRRNSLVVLTRLMMTLTFFFLFLILPIGITPVHIESSTETNFQKIAEVKPFLISYLHYFQWSNILILNQGLADDLFEHFSHHLIPITIFSIDDLDINDVINYRSVIVISNNPMAAYAILREAFKLKFSPTSWILLITGNYVYPNYLYIPNHINFVSVHCKNETVWQLFRLYSMSESVLKALNIGEWNLKMHKLDHHFSLVPITNLIEKPLRLVTSTLLPYFGRSEIDPEHRIGGIFGDLLEVIRQAVFFNSSVHVTKAFGMRVNSSYVSGMIGRLHRDESDIGLALTYSKDRAEVIDYSPALIFSSAEIIYHNQEGAEKRFFYYLEPFTTSGWIGIIGLTAILPLFFIIIRKCKGRLNIIKCFDYYITRSVYTLLQSGITISLNDNSGRAVLFVFNLFCVLLFIHYGSNLTSILAVFKLKVPFENFRDLVLKSDYEVSTQKDTSIQSTFKESKHDLYVTAYQRMLKNPKRLLLKSVPDALEFIYNKKIAFIMEAAGIAFLVQGNCSFRFMDKSLYQLDFSYLYNKRLIHRNLFNTYCRIIFERGIKDKVFRDQYPSKHNTACDREKMVLSAISIPTVLGLFFTLFAGIVASAVIFAIELYLGKCLTLKKKVRKRKTKVIKSNMNV